MALLKTLVLAALPYMLALLSGRHKPLNISLLRHPVIIGWIAIDILALAYWVVVHALIIQFGRRRPFNRGAVLFCLLLMDMVIASSVYNELHPREEFWFGLECVPHVVALLLLVSLWRPTKPTQSLSAQSFASSENAALRHPG